MSMKNKSKLSKEVVEAIIGRLAKPMENGKDSIQEIIISEYEKSQKNIQPVWIGEGWHKGTPDSFNYFASGFEAGMEFVKKQKENN